MSLLYVIGYAVILGTSIGITYRITGANPGDVGFIVLNLLSKNLDPGFQALIILGLSIMTIFSIYRMAKFFRNIYEYKFAGFSTAGLGFFGALLVVLSPQSNEQIILAGLGIIVIGLIIVFATRKKIV